MSKGQASKERAQKVAAVNAKRKECSVSRLET